MKKLQKVNISELKLGPIRHQVLPEGFIVRVQKYKNIIKEVETMSLEETIDSFKRDLNPEREIIIWEAVASAYDKGVKNNPQWGIIDKKEEFERLMGRTLGL